LSANRLLDALECIFGFLSGVILIIAGIGYAVIIVRAEKAD
jgi:hypothetical protein